MKTRILVIITIIVTALMSQNIFAQEMMNRKGGENNFQIFQKLNLTDEQQDQISTLRLNHQMEMVDLDATLQKKQLEMAELKNTGSYTREDYINKVEDMNTAENQIAISKANFQMDVYQLLDDNQKKEWNKFSRHFTQRNEQKMMRKMRDVQTN